MNLEIYEAKTINFNTNVEGFLSYRQEEYFIIPIDTMIVSNGAEELNDLVYLGCYRVNPDTIKLKYNFPIYNN